MLRDAACNKEYALKHLGERGIKQTFGYFTYKRNIKLVVTLSLNV